MVGLFFTGRTVSIPDDRPLSNSYVHTMSMEHLPSTATFQRRMKLDPFPTETRHLVSSQ